MHIINLLRGKSVSHTHSNILYESKRHKTPNLDEFVSHISNRDFDSALEIIKGRNNVETSIFLIGAFDRDPVAGREFLDFWQSKLESTRNGGHYQ